MRKFPIATVAALALMIGAASAQTTSDSPSRPSAPGAMMAPTAKPRPAINPLAQEDVSRIDGTSVYGSDDAKIGHVSTILMNPGSKQIDRLVVSTGGVL